VEIDASYYGVPVPRTVAAWAERTPESFLISAKFPREIVHGGEDRHPDPSRILDPDLTYAVRDEFLRVMAGLGPRLGPLVLQFPFFGSRAFPEPGVFLERLDRFLADLPPDLRVAVEVRDRGWIGPELAGVCRARGAALVLADIVGMPHGDEVEPRLDPVTAAFSYVRLIGDRHAIERVTTTWDREVLDHGPRLDRWGRLLARLLRRDVPTMVYVNNHYAGHAPATLERLRRAFLDALEGPAPGAPSRA
jgi:uncharacterized protein YecE (DUF72 family)